LTFGGYADKTFGCISVTESESGLDLFAAGPYTFVRSWKLSNQEVTRSEDYWPTDLRGNEWIKTLDVGMLNGVAVMAAGNEEGILLIWEKATKREIGVVREAHRGGITALALLEHGNGLITSGGDGYLRVWSPTLTRLLEIDLEEAAIRLFVPRGFRDRVVVVTRSGLLAIQLNL
jgi:WD40 repeat protein